MNYMSPLEILGRPFDQVKDQFPNSGILEVYDCLADGDEQEYYVTGPDHLWEFLLDKNSAIRTIFLYTANGHKGFDGIHHLSKQDEVLEKYGAPHKSGEEKEISILGKKGAWERYEYPTYVLHIEHSVGADTVEKITIMLPCVAP